MLIYRIEKNGDGPYARDDGDDDYIIPVCERRHPSLRMEDYAAANKFREWKSNGFSVRFGFSSLEQLGRWFTLKEQGILREMGFSILCYAIPAEDVILTKRQAAFKHAKAVEVGEVDWPTKPYWRTPKAHPQQMELF